MTTFEVVSEPTCFLGQDVVVMVSCQQAPSALLLVFAVNGTIKIALNV